MLGEIRHLCDLKTIYSYRFSRRFDHRRRDPERLVLSIHANHHVRVILPGAIPQGAVFGSLINSAYWYELLFTKPEKNVGTFTRRDVKALELQKPEATC